MATKPKLPEPYWEDVTPDEWPTTIHEWQVWLGTVRRKFDYPMLRMKLYTDKAGGIGFKVRVTGEK